MKNRNEELKAHAKRNVLSTEETCDTLKVSRQYLYNLIKEEKLQPLKQIKDGYLFWKPDILKFNSEKHIKSGYGLSTYKALQDFDNLKLNPKQIDSIHIYRYGEDAAIEGFYNVNNIPENDQLTPINTPTFIIKMQNSTEYWFSGFLCGYVGTGTGGCEKVLYKLGVLDEYNTRKSEAYLASSYVIHIYNTGDGWETTRSDGYINELYEMLHKMSGIQSRLCSYNGKLVLAIERNGINFNKTHEVPTEKFIKKCFEFIEDATTFKQSIVEKALDTEHPYAGSSKKVLKTILSNDRDKELWMTYPNYEEYETDRQTIYDILTKLGLEIANENTSSSFLDKLKKFPQIISQK